MFINHLIFFFTDSTTAQFYTLSLHDALPIFSVTDTNSSRTSEAALWPSTYISPLSNSTPCIRKDRISSKSLMRLSICLWKPSIGDSERVEMPQASIARSEERFSRNAETDLVC